MIRLQYVCAIALAVCLGSSNAYTVKQTNQSPPPRHASATTTTSRREAFGMATTWVIGASSAGTLLSVPQVSNAFDGGGASAYSGRTPQSKAEAKKSYQTRVIADVRDFNNLGKALLDRGELKESKEWYAFFVQFPRREMDPNGRAYAALADFIGHDNGNGKLEGSVGYLLANSFTKSGKPPDNTPAVKAYKKVETAFAPIKQAADAGDLAKAQKAYTAAGVLLSQFLEQVELPSDLSDPSYN